MSEDIDAVLRGERKWCVAQGDSLSLLRGMPDGCIQCAVTSPPYYALRSYLKPDDPLKPMELGQEKVPDCLGWATGSRCGECFVCKMTAVFRELRRVLRGDGTFWLNIAGSYNSHPGQRKTTDTVGAKQETNGGSNTIGSRSVDGWKAKDYINVPALLAESLRVDGWYLRSEIALCLSGGTTVYARTQKGDMPCTVKDLVRLRPDTVKLWNGQKWTQAVAWKENPRPGSPLQIELRSGERIGCTPEHLWPTQRGNVRADELSLGDVIQTTVIPQREDAARPDMLPDDDIGWLIGFYIAEGNDLGKCVILATHIDECEEYRRVQKIAAMCQATATRKRIRNTKTAVIRVHGKVLVSILRQYVSGDVSKNKRLTNACWQRSNEFLSCVLQGYLDGDGHYVESQRQWKLGFTNNPGLASDIRTLCARLGISLRLKRAVRRQHQPQPEGHRTDGRRPPADAGIRRLLDGPDPHQRRGGVMSDAVTLYFLAYFELRARPIGQPWDCPMVWSWQAEWASASDETKHEVAERLGWLYAWRAVRDERAQR